MASILNADNGVVSGSAGLKSNADSSGVLELQTNGTTAVTVNTNQSVSLTAGTANGVTYLNGSKVLTSGSALTFDGTALAVGTSTIGTNNRLTVDGGRLIVANGPTGSSSSATKGLQMYFDATNNQGYIFSTQSGVANYPLNVSSSTLSLASSLTTFTISGSEAMRLDSAGNLGLGVTPSAWGSNYKAMEFGDSNNQSFFYGQTNADVVSMGTNAYNNNTNYIYKNNGYSTFYLQYNGEHRWSTAASGTAGNAISFTQAMTLDASGNLGVGTTTPGPFRLQVSGTGGTLSGTAKFVGVFNDATASSKGVGLGYDTSSQTGILYAETGSAASNLAFWTYTGSAWGERARIDSSGRFLVGQTTYSTTTDGVALQASGSVFAKSGTSNTTNINLANGNGVVGTINTSGTSTSYNTSSDYRLKNTIAPMTGALAKVALLKPVTYKWNCDGSDSQGFIAHELAEVVPDCVSGEKDAVDKDGNPKYQGIDTSFLVATLTAALQEAHGLIKSLETRITALEAK